MEIKDWGEEKWIAYLKEQFPPHDFNTGIGDDCAVIPFSKKQAWLVTTDALVEGVHFLKNKISPRDLGYKSIAVNVSDIAAMGGKPKFAFLSIALPKNTECHWAKELIAGIQESCRKWEIQILGGDTVGSHRDIFINLTLVGENEIDKIKYRTGAQLDDMICVTGYLGDAGAGLQIILEGKPAGKHLILAQYRPQPSWEQGKWLASHDGVHAMMDLSDGLNCDLRRLVKSSDCGARIELSQIPLSPELKQTCQDYQWDALKFALTGGEDYSLLLTVSQNAWTEIQMSFKKKFGSDLYAIGRITDQKEHVEYLLNKNPLIVNSEYFDHFK